MSINTSIKGELINLADRFILLIAKLLSFKACCMYLATVLLCTDHITGDIWATIVIAVICGRVSGFITGTLIRGKNSEQKNQTDSRDSGSSVCLDSADTSKIRSTAGQRARELLNRYRREEQSSADD